MTWPIPKYSKSQINKAGRILADGIRIILNLKERTVNIHTYSQSNLDAANQEYTEAERKIANGEPIQAVLVSAGPIDNLRRAYPNYFLDTREFIQQLDRIERRP